MLNIGPLELIVILMVALIVVGPQKLPEVGRTIGKGLREFRKAQDEVRKSLQIDELKDVRRDVQSALKLDLNEPAKPASKPAAPADKPPTQEPTPSPAADLPTATPPDERPEPPAPGTG